MIFKRKRECLSSFRRYAGVWFRERGNLDSTSHHLRSCRWNTVQAFFNGC